MLIVRVVSFIVASQTFVKAEVIFGTRPAVARDK
jgi:hypothetical protein